MNMPQIYDIAKDEMREATQEDVDRLELVVQFLGARVGLARKALRAGRTDLIERAVEIGPAVPMTPDNIREQIKAIRELSDGLPG